MLDLEKLVNPAPSGESDANRAARGNRRRLRVFLAAFLTVLTIGLAFTYARPAEYRAQAQIAVKTAVPVTSVAPATPRSATVTTLASDANAGSLQTEASILVSRPLIEAMLGKLRQQGIAVPEFGPEPVSGIQAALTAEPVADTSLINLTVTGPQYAHLPAILNALIEAYSRQTFESYAASASSESGTLRQELEHLEQRLDDKKNVLEEFRQSADIVSGERDENQILARVKGLSVSLNVVNEKIAEAEGRVRSLRESQAAGRATIRVRDNPTLAGLEARASQLRESLREQERLYTPQFMAMDPNVRGMQSRLANLDRQIAEQQGSSGQIALAEAENVLAENRLSRQRLQQKIAEERSAVHAFARTFSTFKSMEEELAQLEASRRSLSERLLRTETSETSRMPSIQVIETASASTEPWRPNYSRDAGISVAVALAAGLLAMALIELFNRPPQASVQSTIQPQPWVTLLDHQPSLSGTMPFRQPAQTMLPGTMDRRELSQSEVSQLLRAMHEDDLPWAMLLLCGATQGEVRRVVESDLHDDGTTLRISGANARTITIPASLGRRIEAATTDADGPRDEAITMPDSDEELERRLICAAHDAGLDDPATITPEMLRHTCIAYLVRQGLRFSELDHIVGALPGNALREYASLSPSGVRRTVAQIQPLMPALEAA